MRPDKNWAVERARYQVKVGGDHESNPGGPNWGSWDQIWLPGPSEDVRTQAGLFIGTNYDMFRLMLHQTWWARAYKFLTEERRDWRTVLLQRLQYNPIIDQSIFSTALSWINQSCQFDIFDI